MPDEQPVFRRAESIISRAQYRRHTAALAGFLRQSGAQCAVLLTEDNYHFAVGMMAALHAGLGVALPGNLRAGAAEHGRAAGNLALTDEVIAAAMQSGQGAPLQPFDAAAASVCFYTSGSSGVPKRVCRTFANLEAELVQLAPVLPEGEEAEVFSTSPFHHAYGIIFGFLLPLSRGLLSDTSPFVSPADFLGRVDRLATPGRLAWVVTTPAFIRVWAENPDVCALRHRPLRIQAAGAPLAAELVERLHSRTRAQFFEIFGSTETGVAAHRDPHATREWTPFADVRITPAEEGGMWIESPCVAPGEKARPGDNAQLLPNGNFLLLPRADDVVKIADKRISLTEIERFAEGSELVSQAAVLKLEGKKRPIPAAVVVPSAAGMELLRAQGRTALRRALVAHLSRHLPTVFVPKRWRILGSLPTNSRGKTDRAALCALFNSRDYMPVVSPVEQGESHLVVRALYPVDSAWAPGHFPDYPLTPGVVLLRTISSLLEQYWHRSVTCIQRLKFCAEVIPGDEIYIILDLKGDSASVLMTRTPDGKTPTGKGILRLRQSTKDE